MSWNRGGFNTPIKFAPGESWLYGPALDWAGLALEAITGDTLGAYMQRHIFEPLGMKDTGFWPERLSDEKLEERGVEPVERKETGGKLVGVPAWQPKEHEIESGGAGLYSTNEDYAKFLSAFLKGELLSDKSMEEVFTPQLDDTQRAAMEAIAYHSGEDVRMGFTPEFPVDTPINHGLAGVLNLEDVEGKRRKGSIMWSGMVNSRWWVDRETGIAAILVVHLMPHGDRVVGSLIDQLESGVYEALKGGTD
ncbi:beta-lactamase/transpeptidase-like protein [Sarocladium strictum]